MVWSRGAIRRDLQFKKKILPVCGKQVYEKNGCRETNWEEGNDYNDYKPIGRKMGMMAAEARRKVAVTQRDSRLV